MQPEKTFLLAAQPEDIYSGPTQYSRLSIKSEVPGIGELACLGTAVLPIELTGLASKCSHTWFSQGISGLVREADPQLEHLLY